MSEDDTAQDAEAPEVDVPVAVPDAVRGLLCALAYGWTPTPMSFGRVEQLRYADLDLSDGAQDLDLCENRLRVTVGGRGIDMLMPFPRDGQVDGTLAGGARFHGDMVLSVARSMSTSQDSGLREVMTIETGMWTVTEGDAPSLWIGPVEGTNKIDFSGNLIIERRTAKRPFAGHRRHFVFCGEYTYYFAQCRAGERDRFSWHLLIDTNGTGTPDREVLGRDFLTVEFVFGCQMRMPMLFGVAPDRRTVACTLGYDRRRNLEKRNSPPVPMVRDNDKWIDMAWAPVFFQRISDTWRTLPRSDKSYWLALDMYLDAMQLHLDFDYMRLQIALEAFAFWLLRQRSQGDPMDVRDKDAWEKWVRDNKAAIRAHAIEGREDALVQKVKGACRLASGNVVPSAFSTYGIKLTKELREELRGRDIVVHQGLMAPEGYDADKDLRRVALVRTMLVALIARSVGYGGAINGWEIGARGYPMEQQDWWQVSNDDRVLAQRRFIAEEWA